MKIWSQIYGFNLLKKTIYDFLPFFSRISTGFLIFIFAFIISQHALSGAVGAEVKPIIAVASDGQDIIYVLTS